MKALEEKITKAIEDIFGNNHKALFTKEMVIEYTIANFKQAIEEERQAWLNCERCIECGKPLEQIELNRELCIYCMKYMTQLEEKIESKMKEFEEKFTLEVIVKGHSHPSDIKSWIKEALQSIATQAVEEERKRILDGLPKVLKHEEEGVNKSHEKEELWCCLDCKDDIIFNRCLSQVKSLINKSN